MAQATYREIPNHLRSRTAFRGNSARGEVNPAGVSRGRLPSDVATPTEVAYVVYSYGTPVAWVLPDGTAVVPDVRYSVTTSRLQRLCSTYL